MDSCAVNTAWAAVRALFPPLRGGRKTAPKLTLLYVSGLGPEHGTSAKTASALSQPGKQFFTPAVVTK